MQLNAKKVAKQKSAAFNSKFIRSKNKSYPKNESVLEPFQNTCTRCFPWVPSNNIHRKFCINFFAEGTTVDAKWKISGDQIRKVAFLSRLDQSKKVFQDSKKQVTVVPLFKRVVFWRERNGRGNMSREGETLSSVKKWVPFCTVTFSPEHILARSKLSFEYCSQKWLLFSKLRRRMIY